MKKVKKQTFLKKVRQSSNLTYFRTGFRRIFTLSFHWFGVVGILLTVILGSIISFFTGEQLYL